MSEQHVRLPRSRPLAPPPPGSGLKAVPGHPGMPVVGEALRFMRDFEGLARARYSAYGPVSWGGFLGRRGVLAQGPEAAETILSGRDPAFAAAPVNRWYFGPLLPGALLMFDGEPHREQRRLMGQAFTRPRMRRYHEAMRPGIESAVARWRPGPAFRLYDHVERFTFDLAAEVFMGVGADDENTARIAVAFRDLMQAPFTCVRFRVPGLPRLRWAKGLRARALLEDFLYARLPAGRRGDGDDLFTALCQAEEEDGGRRFGDREVVDHMIHLLQAAHDTTTITIAAMAYFLGREPAWQERLRAEARSVLGDPGTPGVAYADLPRLALTGQVMKESLRLVSPVLGQIRQTVADAALLGHHVPAGTTVFVPTLTNQRLPQYWPDPERFDPGRFAPERGEDAVHRYAWAPFGGGVHKCIGLHFADMQVKAIMSEMLRRYRWRLPAGTGWPFGIGTLTTVRDGLPIVLERLPSAVRSVRDE
ncbi:cytochrome P450 [Actinomadura algeriensis]|uniref:Cytochrome P450 n=1 Tax=Actinomadura algeriensis TaxID=1679523 RepID=A0ABR9K3T3_9ACTN|nr:cytochrome P450 [Actinomadura algeriensis]MBE1537258.1 cytochrome P450 [Actinomadura algeriensis]